MEGLALGRNRDGSFTKILEKSQFVDGMQVGC